MSTKLYFIIQKLYFPTNKLFQNIDISIFL